MIWSPRVLASGLAFPEGPALHDGGVVFVEIRAGRVARLADGIVTEVARTGGGPNGIAVARDGIIVVANNGGLSVGPGGYWHADEPIAGRVQAVDADGTVSDLVTDFPADPPHRPNDVCFGPDGLLYFTDPCNWEDLANLRTGRVWRAPREGGEPELVAEVPWFPNGIAFGPDGRLYVAQSITQTVLVLGPSGRLDEHAKLPVGFPDGICFAANGDLIACGSMGHTICVFDPSGTLRQVIEPGEGTEPTNCCLGDGVLYVTFSGTGELVANEVDLAPFPLHG